MADFPAMPLWTDAYLADTRHLSDAEHGRYLLMLMDMWRTPEKRFPNDNDWLARKFGRSIGDIETLFRPLIVEFFSNDGNWITQKRLAREWKRVRANAKQRRDAAKSRWNKAKGDAGAYTGPHMQPEPEPEPHKDIPDASHPRRLTASDQQDLDALFYQRGKALLGQKAGGQLTKLRAAVGLGAALQIIDDAQRKDSPAEYVAGCIRAKGNGHERRGNERASVVEAVRWLDERREADSPRAGDDAPPGEVRKLERR